MLSVRSSHPDRSVARVPPLVDGPPTLPAGERPPVGPDSQDDTSTPDASGSGLPTYDRSGSRPEHSLTATPPRHTHLTRQTKGKQWIF